jgi:hypothetical protein
MSEYELLELLNSASFAATEVFMYYVTILGSYLVASYVVGSNLTSIQALTISVLFIFAALLGAYTTFSYMTRAIEAANSLELLHPERFYGAQPYAQRALLVLQVLGIIVCLKFMWDIRHPKTT